MKPGALLISPLTGLGELLALPDPHYGATTMAESIFRGVELALMGLWPGLCRVAHSGLKVRNPSTPGVQRRTWVAINPLEGSGRCCVFRSPSADGQVRRGVSSHPSQPSHTPLANPPIRAHEFDRSIARPK